ncbi:hypothetical protein CDL12_04657 [Handroanthus impetiginosus]|uniref:Uncharacterized protein n=1 Tax=Handroanthus impetiginosus TaxID=429701 RepID=A0A2G9HYN5_9LAMI|nr:hypothetical protein CDL12_04657 [Handroanthus impetiginosus]
MCVWGSTIFDFTKLEFPAKFSPFLYFIQPLISFVSFLCHLLYRQELQVAREKQKEEEVEVLKRAMQSGMAQAMKEQAQLREEMAYQYKLGNFEAAAAIQRRLDPDIAM